MALNYSVSLRPNPLDKDAAPKAYATSQINGELTLKQLSKRVSSQTTVSRADVVAVLTATVDNLLEALTEGKQVDFGELGKFRLQIASIGTEKTDGFHRRPYHRSQYPICSRRGFKNHLRRTGIPTCSQPCRTGCRTACRKGRKNRGRPAEEQKRAGSLNL